MCKKCVVDMESTYRYTHALLVINLILFIRKCWKFGELLFVRYRRVLTRYICSTQIKLVACTTVVLILLFKGAEKSNYGTTLRTQCRCCVRCLRLNSGRHLSKIVSPESIIWFCFGIRRYMTILSVSGFSNVPSTYRCYWSCNLMWNFVSILETFIESLVDLRLF
jgi:hypothetical protein